MSNLEIKLEDNLYNQQQPLSNIVVATIDDYSIQQIGRFPWDRTVFGDLFKQLKSAKVVAVDVAFFEPTDKDNDVYLTDNLLMPVEYDFENKLIMKSVFKADYGYVNVLTDRDGITRSFYNGLPNYDAFPVSIAKKLGKDVNLKGRIPINFIGKPKTFPYYRIYDIINNKYPKDFFKNKIVLVGATSPDLHDDYFVPTSQGKAMPGVELHANALQMILTNNFLTYAGNYNILIIILAILLTYYISKLIAKKNLYYSIGSSILLIFIYVMIVILFSNKNIILNIIYPILSIILTTTFFIIGKYFSEERQKKQIKKAFSKYLAPEVIKQVLADPKKLNLGGKKTVSTIFFSDIRGFTTMSEKMTAEALVELLNHYLSDMTKIVLEHKGTVDKFIGDAIMALWNVPLKQKNHAELACQTAIQMIDSLKEFNKKHNTNIDIGIGLNTGECVVGNLGSEDRFDYTAIGDSVNLAARLEGLNKQYKTKIIVSEYTYELVKKKFSFRLLDKVKVKGKRHPVQIYELKKERTNDDDIYEEALSYYFKQDFKKALNLFLQLNNKEFIERCEYFIKNPIDNWDGSFTMKTK